MPRGDLFTMHQMVQLDFLVKYARRELNLTPRRDGKGLRKLRGPGERFVYSVSCPRCDDFYAGGLTSAKRAHDVLVPHLYHGNGVFVTAEPRDRTRTEISDSARKRRHSARAILDSHSAKALIKALRERDLDPREADEITGNIKTTLAIEDALGRDRLVQRDGKYHLIDDVPHIASP
jgi:hypothetical protein